MKALILAAGRGSRLQRLTEKRPKCLVTVHGQPLLHWQLQALRAAGIEEIAVVRGYRKEAISCEGLTYFDNDRWAETNMVRSLLAADEWLREEECIISYADLIYPPAVIEKLCRVPAHLSLTYDPNWLTLWQARFDDPLTDSETFAVNSRGELLEIGSRAASTAGIQGQYMGLLKITPTGWQELRSDLQEVEPGVIDRMDMTALLSYLLQRGRTIQTVSIENDWWYEIDSARDLEWARQNLL